MPKAYQNRYVPDEDRRELLKALGVMGTITVGGASLAELQANTPATAPDELASIGDAIRSDLAGSIDAALLTTQQTELASATTALDAVTERGIPVDAARNEFAPVAEAGRPMYDHLNDVGFFESTTTHLPRFNPGFLTDAVGTFAASETLTEPLAELELTNGAGLDLIAEVVANAEALSTHHWVATDEINRDQIEGGEHIPPMTMGAAGGALLWLEWLDDHLWRHHAILTEDILADAVWHGRSMGAGLYLMAEGAKTLAADQPSLADEELGAVLSTGFAVQAISQGLLTLDVAWINDDMRGEPDHDLATITEGT